MFIFVFLGRVKNTEYILIKFKLYFYYMTMFLFIINQFLKLYQINLYILNLSLFLLLLNLNKIPVYNNIYYFFL